MAEIKNDCSSCVHEPICKYAETFKKSMDDIVKIANDRFEAYGINGLVDLSIWCRQYVMTPYQKLKTNGCGVNAFLEKNNLARNMIKACQQQNKQEEK